MEDLDLDFIDLLIHNCLHYRDSTALELLVEVMEMSVIDPTEATEAHICHAWNTLMCLLSEDEMNEAIDEVLASVADDQSGDSTEVEDTI